MDIAKLISEKMAERLAPGGYFEQKLNENLDVFMEKMAKAAMDEMAGWNSPIQKAIKESVQFNPEELRLPEYHKILVEKFNNLYAEYLRGTESPTEDFVEKIQEMLKLPPKEITAEDFFQRIAEIIAKGEEDPCNCEGKLEYLDIERDFSTSCGGLSFQVFDEPETHYGHRTPRVHVYFSKGETIRIIHTPALNITTDRLDTLDSFLVQLYARETVIKGIQDFCPDNHSFAIHEE